MDPLAKAFDHFNLLNPDSQHEGSDEDDLDGGEMYTKEYFDRLDNDN